mmetsp:Transcript_2031/g.5530  ORF Transcript_2031/g.5530 Transcript_2031/m.5530 type:complete len:203 (-) Transcript_2031:472-1080(-)
MCRAGGRRPRAGRSLVRPARVLDQRRPNAAGVHAPPVCGVGGHGAHPRAGNDAQGRRRAPCGRSRGARSARQQTRGLERARFAQSYSSAEAHLLLQRAGLHDQPLESGAHGVQSATRGQPDPGGRPRSERPADVALLAGRAWCPRTGRLARASAPGQQCRRAQQVVQCLRCVLALAKARLELRGLPHHPRWRSHDRLQHLRP